MILRVLCCFLAFLQLSLSADIQPAKLVSYRSQRIIIPLEQYQQQQNVRPTHYVKEYYFYEDGEDKTKTEALTLFSGLQQKYQTVKNTIHNKPDANLNKYHTLSGAQTSIIQQYGRDTARTQSRRLSSNQKYGSGSSNKNLQIHSVLSDNTPVSKNYAMNFLPTGIDVVPGSSYIPLVKKL